MSIEDLDLEARIRGDLRHAVVPPTLAPPADLAGTVLQDLRRQRRTRVLVTALAAVAVVAAAAVAVPIGLSQRHGETGPDIIVAEPGTPSSLPFPTPGGGPRAILAYSSDDPTSRTFLLDPITGEYREYPFAYVALSPDLRMLAFIAEDGGAGLIDVATLLDGDMEPWRPLEREAYGRPVWSPDGTAVLFTSVASGNDGEIAFTAHRVDVDNPGEVTDTPVNADLLGNSVGWAADSNRYLALLRGEQGTDTVEPGALQYIEPDGTLGERIEITGGYVGGAESYSPSGRYALVDSSAVASAQPVPSKVLDFETGDIVTTLPGGRAMPIGWYDDTTVAQVVRGATGEGTLELVDITTGEVTERIALRGLPTPVALQIGSSEELTGAAEERGF